ncbi:MAG: alpha/beta hydrolase [bacterium]|nr:alpha/beta hydrolase [bacterium]
MTWPAVLVAGLLVFGVGVAPSAVADTRAAASCAAATNAGHDVRLNVQYANAAGTRIAWAEVGDGKPLLLLNGTGSPMAEWDPALLARLAVDRRVLVFDYPGLGLSGATPKRMTFSAMSDWTADLINVLGLNSPDVLGWSMGGFIAQQLAIRHPNSVGRLVLAGTNPGGTRAALGPTWVQEADSDAEGSVATYLATNYPRTTCAQRAGREFVQRLTRAVDSGRYPDESVPARTYNAMVAAEDPWLESNANKRSLAKVTAATLVVTGDEDLITPPANSRVIADRIPGAELHLVGGAGHSFLFQHPARVARIVLDFLNG